ncbi:MAG TPA: sulfotransferase [Sphingomicrobium sp.]|nr:sulfotransferase [Sphingomicrobium sp.]
MSLRVIGAGFGRTGTMSLKLALERLCFGPCYHMTEVFKNPEAAGYWEAAADGKPVDWEQIFAGYQSSVDWPGATFYRQLADTYPRAKVILTVREPEAWFKSTQATIFARQIPDDTREPWERMALKVIADLFDRQMRDKKKLIEVYERHNEAVQREIAPDRLLVYEVSQGWEPLCGFLGASLPAEPMPRVNTTEEFQQQVAVMMAERAEER